MLLYRIFTLTTPTPIHCPFSTISMCLVILSFSAKVTYVYHCHISKFIWNTNSYLTSIYHILKYCCSVISIFSQCSYLLFKKAVSLSSFQTQHQLLPCFYSFNSILISLLVDTVSLHLFSHWIIIIFFFL